MVYSSLLVLALCLSSSLAQRGCQPGRTQCPTSTPYEPVSITQDSNNRYIKTTGQITAIVDSIGLSKAKHLPFAFQAS